MRDLFALLLAPLLDPLRGAHDAQSTSKRDAGRTGAIKATLPIDTRFRHVVAVIIIVTAFVYVEATAGTLRRMTIGAGLRCLGFTICRFSVQTAVRYWRPFDPGEQRPSPD